MAIIGDTIRVTALFKDWTGAAVNPINPVLKVYELESKEPKETIPLQEPHRIDTGTYQVDYTIPDGHGYLVLEVSGEAGGMPQVTRVIVNRYWAPPREG
jgi:hypothetical protein